MGTTAQVEPVGAYHLICFALTWMKHLCEHKESAAALQKQHLIPSVLAFGGHECCSCPFLQLPLHHSCDKWGAWRNKVFLCCQGFPRRRVCPSLSTGCVLSMAVKRQLPSSWVPPSARWEWQHPGVGEVVVGRSAELRKVPFSPLLLHVMLFKSRSDMWAWRQDWTKSIIYFILGRLKALVFTQWSTNAREVISSGHIN